MKTKSISIFLCLFLAPLALATLAAAPLTDLLPEGDYYLISVEESAPPKAASGFSLLHVHVSYKDGAAFARVENAAEPCAIRFQDNTIMFCLDGKREDVRPSILEVKVYSASYKEKISRFEGYFWELSPLVTQPATGTLFSLIPALPQNAKKLSNQ